MVVYFLVQKIYYIQLTNKTYGAYDKRRKSISKYNRKKYKLL